MLLTSSNPTSQVVPWCPASDAISAHRLHRRLRVGTAAQGLRSDAGTAEEAVEKRAGPVAPSFSPTRVRVQHDTFIRASRAAMWSLMQDVTPARKWQQVAVVLATLESIYGVEYQGIAEQLLTAFQQANRVPASAGTAATAAAGPAMFASDLDVDQRFDFSGQLGSDQFDHLALGVSLNTDFLWQLFVKVSTEQLDATLVPPQLLGGTAAAAAAGAAAAAAAGGGATGRAAGGVGGAAQLLKETESLLVLRRGYSSEQQRGRWLLQKLDYLQLLLSFASLLHSLSEWGFIPRMDVTPLEVFDEVYPLLEPRRSQPLFIEKATLPDIMDPVIEPRLRWLERKTLRLNPSSSSSSSRSRSLDSLSAAVGSTDDSSSGTSSWEAAAASIDNTSSSSSSSSSSSGSGSLLQTLLEPVEIVEPTFRQMLVVYRKKPKQERWREAWFKLTGQKVAPVARRLTIQLQVYRDIPLPSWQVVFPDKLLQFRPLDLLRLDLFGLAGIGAVLAQAKYTSLVLELVTLVSLSVWGSRLVLGFLRMGDRYKSIVAQLLAERTVAGGEGGLEYLATAAGLQQFKQAALAYVLLAAADAPLNAGQVAAAAEAVLQQRLQLQTALKYSSMALHMSSRGIAALKGASKGHGVRSVPLRPAGLQSGACRMPARQLVSARVAEMTRPTHQDDEAMFCYQCEQTKGNTGCTKIGVCGKTSQVAILQDLLIYQLKGLGAWANFAHQTTNLPTPEVDSFVKAAIFATLTNVNFDPERFVEYITKADDFLQLIRNKLQQAGVEGRPTAAALPWFDLQGNPMDFSLRSAMAGTPINADTLESLGEQVSLLHRREVMGEANSTLLGLHELLTYGLKGVAAYAHHAEMLGKVDASLDDTFEEVLAFLASEASSTPEAVLGMCMRLGEVNFKVMALLDDAHTSRFGHPTPTQVRITPVKGKAILISGHDMHDLHDLLRQTEGTGINVYTHGEMLPGHGYPELHKFKHLVGNYGGAWYRQKKDFAEFPGAILMTTNCIMDPSPAYADRIFTTGEVGVSASKHLSGTPGAKDFSEVIARAQQLPGFSHEPEAKEVTVGFGHQATLGAASAVLDAIKAGQLSHIFLIGGCDAPEPSRKYYTDVVKGLPEDTMVLTLGCGKYRFYDQDLGTLANGLPRLLDMGQCNDAYSALVVATELAKALDTDVNSLPLSLDISWFEQKAVAVLLTLLNLGVKNIRLGPQLPAFCTPDMIDLLVKTFDLKAADTKHPEDEIKRMMANA
ncbi:hypothetical protein OEZ85_005859 [Tetradesmus obliquus]|uniref:Hydroxylamine reductase n=1 Tax=Tetradesmus obliquus TaxID=3088 RepID=A0ABY8UFP5_TETOB|nr:hypothetical protein OEZ85_005859 [Tetradesmus obliquus]